MVRCLGEGWELGYCICTILMAAAMSRRRWLSLADRTSVETFIGS
jgi:hypothetical protein